VKPYRLGILYALFWIVVSAESMAQRTTATFAGVVRDGTDAVLPGAEAELVNEGTSAVLQRVTNERGEFLFDFLPAATYTLKIAMPGFRTFESRGIPLGAAQNVRRTYVLEVGAVTDSVTVTGDAPLVNTISPEQRFNLETLQVTNLPMVNRNISSIVEISGGGLTKTDPNIASGFGGTRFRMNGLGGAAMSATADGGDASGFASTSMLGSYGGFAKIELMSAEAVGEVQVVKGVLAAEYTGLSGNLNVMTKSGTNDWHGSLFHRYEGSALSAREPILRTKPNSVWNQFGGSIGGPILPQKAFFFFAYEGYRQHTSTALDNSVPTPRFRDIIRQALPFYETDILLSYYPLPNRPYADNDLLARWIGPGINQLTDDHFDSKIDYLIGGGNLSLAVTGGHPYQVIEAQQKLDPRTFSGHVMRANLVYSISRGRWTSSTHFGGNYSDGSRFEKYWFEKDRNNPETTRGWRGIPAIVFPGMISPNRENRKWGDIPSWTMKQQFSVLNGSHTWKFGANLRLGRGRAPDTTNPDVGYQTLEDLMSNTPSSVNLFTQQGNHTWKMNSFGFYLQDDWRLNQKLILNLGLRYDRYGTLVVEPRGGEDAGFFNFDGLLDPINFIWGPLRDPRRPVEPDNLNIAPRFGFAYTLDDRGDFVMRGGIGLNFAGIDAGNFENRISRKPELPERVTFSRAEAASLGLKFPVYNEGMVPLALAQNRPAQPALRFNPIFESPYAMNYTLGFQKALTPTLVLETAYVGTRGVKFAMFRTYNRVDRVTGVRPNPNDIQNSYVDTSQQTNYNSWQTSLKQRLTRGLAVNFNHTWGKVLSYTGGDTGPGYQGDAKDTVEEFTDIKIERGPSTGDVTHSVSIDWIYQAPTPLRATPVLPHVLGGWQLSGIWRARTGLPFTVSQTGGRPDIVDLENAVNTNCCTYGNVQYLNPAAFQLVEVPRASGRTIRRGYSNYYPIRGPGIWNVDLSMTKNFEVTEALRFELKADMLNALNHTQYTNIATNLSGLVFGEAIGTAPARVIQLQLRLAF
jgi:hypothetical protein